MDLIDLRSDTVTKPGPGMRKAMAEAEVGDDVFGDDPTINRLQAGLAVHVDGGRLWNAQVAAGVPLAEYAAVADTVSVCLSKGLGAPAGSLAASTRERVAKMRRLRKRLGGGLRQAGVLAAAGLYALDHHIERLAEDHRNARKLAELVGEIPGLFCDPRLVDTNLLFVDVSLKGGSQALVAAAKTE